MGNLFQDIINDPAGTEERILGPSYSYADNIKSPDQLGMSAKGDLKTLGKDVTGLLEYVNLLVTGKSKASKTGGPLGNKFFLQTGGKCSDKETKQEVERYAYVNNVPMGNIPFVSGAAGMNFSSLKGIVPGALGNLNAIKPMSILGAFFMGATPECQSVTLETIDTHNNKSTETHYVTTMDLKMMDPCNFMDKKNPVTGQKCKEAFAPMTAGSSLINQHCPNIPNDAFTTAYYASLGLVGVYLVYCIAKKTDDI